MGLDRIVAEGRKAWEQARQEQEARFVRWMGRDPDRVMASVEQVLLRALSLAAKQAGEEAFTTGSETATIAVDLLATAALVRSRSSKTVQEIVSAHDIATVMADLAQARGFSVEGMIVTLTFSVEEPEKSGEEIVSPDEG